MEKETKDITNFISNVELISGISSKNGQPYNFLNIKFIGDYETAVFPKGKDAMYIIKNVIVKE